ncbi:MAG: DUF1476 domain-containing protein [Pseudomonadota bacterium]
MMSAFDDRKKGYEAKFARDAELKFKAESRRNKMLGEWAAAQLGKSGDDVAAYVKDVRRADFEEAGDDDVFRKVKADFEAANVGISDDDLRAKMDQFLADAVTAIESDG